MRRTRPRRRARRLALFAAVLLGAGPAAACGSDRARQDCRLERETVIAVTDSAPADVGLAPGREGSWLAAWSADGATSVAWIDRRPALADGPVRVLREGYEAPAEPGPEGTKTFWEEGPGVSLAAHALQVVPAGDGGALMALVQLPGPDRAGGAHAALLPPPPFAGEPRAVRLGPAGSAADRVTAAVLGGTAVVAWHDVTDEGPRVRLAALDLATMRRTASATFPGSLSRFHPSLAADGTAALLAWAEEDAAGAPGLALRVAPVGPDLALGDQRVAARIGLHDPAPHLAPIPGGFGLLYRDDEDGDAVLEYHFLALDRTGGQRHPPARISRADGPRGPVLCAGGATLFGVTIRSFQRNLLVGLNRLDPAGAKLGGEFQIYADKSDFTRVAAAAEGDAAVLVYAEDRQGRGRVLASRVQCQAP